MHESRVEKHPNNAKNQPFPLEKSPNNNFPISQQISLLFVNQNHRNMFMRFTK